MIPRLTFALKTVDLTEWSVLTLHNKKKQMPKWLKKEKKVWSLLVNPIQESITTLTKSVIKYTYMLP